MNWIDHAYTGQMRLWKVFWLGYVAPLIPVTIGLGILKEAAPPWALFAFFVAAFLYYAWVAIALWHCAPNVKHRIFYFLGRLLAAIIGVTVLGGALVLLKGSP